MRATPYGNNAPMPAAVLENEVKQEEADLTGTTIIGFWLGLLILYAIWDFAVLKNRKLADAIDGQNLRTNLYNLFFIGIAAVIFINGAKVLLVKMGASELPGISWLGKKLLPLFQL